MSPDPCAPTPVTTQDLSRLGFTPIKGKVSVLRVLRNQCPACMDDLHQIGRLFETKVWSKDNVQLYLLSFRKDGVEDQRTFSTFVREQLSQTQIPLEAVQMAYVDKTYYSLVKIQTPTGERLLEGWRTVPFSLVFDREGRLKYKGHFAASTMDQDNNYNLITRLAPETCPPRKP